MSAQAFCPDFSLNCAAIRPAFLHTSAPMGWGSFARRVVSSGIGSRLTCDLAAKEDSNVKSAAPDDLPADQNLSENYTRFIYLVRKSDYIIFRAAGEAEIGKLHTTGKTIITVYANDHLPPIFTSAPQAMNNELPRVEAVAVSAPTTLRLRWRGKRVADTVNLTGWIATGGDILAPLNDPRVFSRAVISNYGTAVTWDDGDGDLSIDALHLSKLAEEQKPFGNHELRYWQDAMRLSNAECADLIGVRLSTWNSYRAKARIPQAVIITLRAATRDPLVVQAHLRPRVAGRPRKSESERKRSVR